MTGLANKNHSCRQFKTLIRLGSLTEPLASMALITVFAVLLFLWTVTPISDYDWVYFLDQDDSYVTEQFLLKVGGQYTSNSWAGRVDYGSELFYYIPIYKYVMGTAWGHPWIEDSPLNAFRLIKSLHILAAVGALLFLRAIMRRLGVARYLVPVALAVLVSSPAILVYAQSMKPDANVVLFTIAAGLWALVRLEATGRTRWLLLAIAMAALGTAVKWWGGFLVLPIVYLSVVRLLDVSQCRVLVSWKSLFLANMVTWVVLLVVVLVQAKYVVQEFPHTEDQTQVVAILLIATIGLVLSAGVAIAWWTRNYLDRVRVVGDKTQNYARVLLWVLVVGSFWAVGFVAFEIPLLLSDQLQPTLTHFSALSIPDVRGDELTLVMKIGNNISKWSVGAFHHLMLPVYLVMVGISGLLIWRNKTYKSRNAKDRAVMMTIALILPIGIFLMLIVSKVSDATMSMILPFMVLLAVVSMQRSFDGLRSPMRNILMVVLVVVLMGQIGWQSVRAADFFARSQESIRTAELVSVEMSDFIDSLIPDDNSHLAVWMAEGHVPIDLESRHTNKIPQINSVSMKNFEVRVQKVIEACDKPEEGYSSEEHRYWLMDREDRNNLGIDDAQLLRRGCVEELKVIRGQSYTRGHPKRYEMTLLWVRP